MRETAGELTDRLHLLRLAQLFLEIAALGDVAGAQVYLTAETPNRRQRRCDALDDVAAVDEFILLGGVGFETRGKTSIDQGGFFGTQGFVDGAADDLVARGFV